MIVIYVLDIILMIAMVRYLKNCALIELDANNGNQYVLSGVFVLFAVIVLIRFEWGITKIVQMVVLGLCALISSQLRSGLYEEGIIILGRNYLKKDIVSISVDMNAIGSGVNFKIKTGYKSLLMKQDDDDVKRYLKLHKFPDEGIL
ncbi:MAG: hypothetical protein HUJ56_09830 [Erysipelotrichaceae bacterium]|nr:hypothetical protein [Erysipelotrichaceae bacterium]